MTSRPGRAPTSSRGSPGPGGRAVPHRLSQRPGPPPTRRPRPATGRSSRLRPTLTRARLPLRGRPGPGAPDRPRDGPEAPTGSAPARRRSRPRGASSRTASARRPSSGPARAQRRRAGADRRGARRAPRGRLRRRRRLRAPLRGGPAQPRRLGRASGSSAGCASSGSTASTSSRRSPRTTSTTSSPPATALLQRRFPTPPETPRDLERALGFLVRKGYELELAHDALRRHGALTLDD